MQKKIHILFSFFFLFHIVIKCVKHSLTFKMQGLDKKQSQTMLLTASKDKIKNKI